MRIIPAFSFRFYGLHIDRPVTLVASLYAFGFTWFVLCAAIVDIWSAHGLELPANPHPTATTPSDTIALLCWLASIMWVAWPRITFSGVGR